MKIDEKYDEIMLAIGDLHTRVLELEKKLKK